jgi:hypothetical protein
MFKWRQSMVASLTLGLEVGDQGVEECPEEVRIIIKARRRIQGDAIRLTIRLGHRDTGSQEVRRRIIRKSGGEALVLCIRMTLAMVEGRWRLKCTRAGLLLIVSTRPVDHLPPNPCPTGPTPYLSPIVQGGWRDNRKGW